MEKDFYVDRRWLATYFEKDWSDKTSEALFEYPAFDKSLLHSPYHEEFVGFLEKVLLQHGLKPNTLLEVGSSVGRTFYEVCKHLPSIQKALLIEPSQNLASAFSQIFESGPEEHFILKGNRETQTVRLASADIRETCKNAKHTLINQPYDVVANEIKPQDLVICSNVIDQLYFPLKLVEFLKEKTKPGGVMALSCTYQWNDKYIDAASEPITDIRELFGQEWQLLDETNLEFKCRRSERHWLSFLSQVCIYQKNPVFS